LRTLSSDNQKALKNLQENQKVEAENDPYDIDIDWDGFTADDESYWDNIFGKNIDWVKKKKNVFFACS
jgi:hypothetical protein